MAEEYDWGPYDRFVAGQRAKGVNPPVPPSAVAASTPGVVAVPPPAPESGYDAGLRGVVESAQAAELTPEEEAARAAAAKPGVIPGGFQAGLYGSGAAAAKTFGFDDTAKWLQRESAKVAPRLDYRDVKGLRSGALYAAGQFASGAGSTLPVIAGGVAGTVAGSAAGPVGALVGGAAGAYGTAFPTEMGETLLDAEEQGLNTKDPKVRQGAFDKALVTSGLEALVPGLGSAAVKIGRRAVTGGVREAVRGVGARTAIGGAGGLGVEGVTEGAQEVAGMEAMARLTGKPVDYQDPEVRAKLVNSILGGAIFGGGFGAAAGALSARGAPGEGLPGRGPRGSSTDVLERDARGRLPESTDELTAPGGSPGEPGVPVGPPGGPPPPPGAPPGAALGAEISAHARNIYDQFAGQLDRARGEQARAPTTEMEREHPVERMFDELPTGKPVARQVLDAVQVGAEPAGAAVSRMARVVVDQVGDLRDALVQGWRQGTVSPSEAGKALDAGLARSVEVAPAEARPALVAQAMIGDGPFTATEPAAQSDLYSKHEAEVGNFLDGGTSIPGSVSPEQAGAWLKKNSESLGAKRTESARLAYQTLPDDVKGRIGESPDFADPAVQSAVGDAYQEHSTKAKIQRMRGMAAARLRKGGPRTFNAEFGQNEFALRDSLMEVIFDREQRSLDASGLSGDKLIHALSRARARSERKANEYAAGLRHVFTEVPGQGRTAVPDDDMIYLFTELLADTKDAEAAKGVFDQAKGLYQSNVDTDLLQTFADSGTNIIQQYVQSVNPRHPISKSQAKQLFSAIQAGLIGVGPGLDRIRTAFMATFGGSPNTFEALVRRIDDVNRQQKAIREPAGFEAAALGPTGEAVPLSERGYVEDEERIEDIQAQEAESEQEGREARGGLPETGYGAQEASFAPEIRMGSKEAMIPTASEARVASVLEGIRQGTFGDVTARAVTIDQAVREITDAATRGEIGIDPDEARSYVLSELIGVLEKSDSDTAAAQLRELLAARSSIADFDKVAQKYSIFMMTPKMERTEGFRPSQVERIAGAVKQKGSAEDGTMALEVPWRGGEPRRREFSAVQLLNTFMNMPAKSVERAEKEPDFVVTLAERFSSALGALAQSTGTTNLFSQGPNPQKAKSKMPTDLADVARITGKEGERIGLQMLLSPAYQSELLNWVGSVVKRGRWDAKIPDVQLQLGDSPYTLDVSSSAVRVRDQAGDVVAGPELRNDLLVYRTRGGKSYTVGDLAEAMRGESAAAAGIDPRELPEALQGNIRRGLKRFGDPFKLFREGTALSEEEKAKLPYAKRLASLEKAARTVIDRELRRREEFQVAPPPSRTVPETEITAQEDIVEPEDVYNEKGELVRAAGEVITEGERLPAVARAVEGERQAIIGEKGLTKAEELLKLTRAQPASSRARAIPIGSRDPSDLPSDVKRDVLAALQPLYRAYMKRRGATEKSEVAEGKAPRGKGEALGVTEEQFARRILAVEGAAQPEVKKANQLIERYYDAVRAAEAAAPEGAGRIQEQRPPRGRAQPAELESLEFMRQTARETEARRRGATNEFGEPLYPTTAELRPVAMRVLGALDRARNANKSSGAARAFDRVKNAVNAGVLNNAELRTLGLSLVENAEKNIPALNATLNELSDRVKARRAARAAGRETPQVTQAQPGRARAPAASVEGATQVPVGASGRDAQIAAREAKEATRAAKRAPQGYGREEVRVGEMSPDEIDSMLEQYGREEVMVGEAPAAPKPAAPTGKNADYAKALERHDWEYQMSDDGGVYRRGEAEWRRLVEQARKDPELARMFVEAYNKNFGDRAIPNIAERLSLDLGRTGGAPTPQGKPAAAESASTRRLLEEIGRDVENPNVSTIVVQPDAPAAVRESLYLSGFTEVPSGSGLWERRETPKTRVQPGEGRVPRGTMDRIANEIRKMLGNKVAVSWEERNFGGSGEWIRDSRDAFAGVIRLAVTAADAMGVAHHEAMHALLQRLQATPEGRKAIDLLVETTSQPYVVAQLHAALEGHPEAQAQLANPLERVTYAYQLYRAKPDFRLAPKAKNWFQGMVEWLRQVSGFLTDTQRADRIFEAFGEGTFSSPPLMNEFLQNQLDDVRSPVTEFRGQRNPVSQAIQKVFYTGDSLMRESGIPALVEVAERIQNRAGAAGGFLPERMRIGSQWVNRFFKTIGDASEQELAQAHENLSLKKAPSTALERGLRTLLDEFYRYLSASNVQQFVSMRDGKPVWKPIPHRKDYYPNVWDAEAIAGNQRAFENLLREHGFEDATKIATNIVSGQVAEDNIQGDFSKGYTPLFGGASARRLDELYDDPRALAFRNKDLVETMHRYLWQGVHRAEHTRHFGHAGQEMRALAARAAEQGATAAQVKAATQYIMAAEGTLGATIDPKLRKIMGGVTIYQNFRILPLALFSQLADPLGIVVRGGTFRDAASAFTRSIKAAFKGIDESDSAEIARLLGTIDDRSALESLGQMYGSVYMSPGQRKINDKFFRVIGLTGWNNGMRVAGTEAALSFFKRQLASPGPQTERWLSELGLQPGDIQMHEGSGRIRLFAEEGLHPDQATRVQQAVNRWVNEAVMRPTAADRPIWASSPYFSLIFYMKQFTYSFNKYILSRAMTEARHGNYTPALALGSYVPVMIAADLVRALIQGAGEEPEWRKKWTAEDYVLNGIQRAGLTGTSQFSLDAIEDAQRGGLGLESWFGPTIAQGLQGVQVLAGQKDLSNYLVSAMPGQVIYKGWL